MTAGRTRSIMLVAACLGLAPGGPACSESLSNGLYDRGPGVELSPNADLGPADSPAAGQENLPGADKSMIPDGRPHEAGSPDGHKPVQDQGPGKEGPIPGTCKSNADCKATNMFCFFATGCGMLGSGVCTVKPTACPSLLDPVCGCDNKDYTNSCLAYAAGTSVNYKGKCTTTLTCTTINTQYTQEVQAAKKCSPILPIVQCTLLVDDNLPCPCKTAINQTNTTQVAAIASLAAQWKILGCDKLSWPCPAVPCKSVTTGKCSATTSLCEDVP